MGDTAVNGDLRIAEAGAFVAYRDLPGLGLAAAPLAWLAVATALVVASLFGYRPLMIPVDLTLPEAAAVRDHLEIARQIGEGVDPNQPGRVRAGLVRQREFTMTPLEAAVLSGQLDTMEFLNELGARIDAATFPTLFCFAELLGFGHVTDYLTEHTPADTVAECDDISLPWTE